MKYQLHGLCLESDIELPGLAPSYLGDVDIRFRLCPPQSPQVDLRVEMRTVAIPLESGELFVELFELPSQYVMRFPQVVDYWVSVDGSEVVCRPHRDVPQEIIGQILLGWVFSLVLHLKRMSGLHASAVIVDGRAVGFVGSSGAGKSTLTAALGMMGCNVLTDEVLVVKSEDQDVLAMPGYREIRLATETVRTLSGLFGHADIEGRVSYDKLALEPDGSWAQIYSEPAPVRILYILAGDEHDLGKGVSFTAIDPKDAPRHLLRHSFVVPKYYREFLNRQFAMMCQLSSLVPVRLLTFCKDMDELPRLADAILEDVARQARSGLMHLSRNGVTSR